MCIINTESFEGKQLYFENYLLCQNGKFNLSDAIKNSQTDLDNIMIYKIVSELFERGLIVPSGNGFMTVK